MKRLGLLISAATGLSLVVAGASLATAAEPFAPVSGSQLRADCKSYLSAPESPGSIRCRAYFQGFLDGAIITDERVARNVAAEYEKYETFSQRAMRTRGRPRVERASTYHAGFCLGQPVPTAAIVAGVIAHLDANPPSASAATDVYAALRANFPCKRTAE